MKKTTIGLIAAAALVSATAVQAATLALWDNDNLLGPTRSNAVNTVAADVSAGYLELGVGLAAPGIGNDGTPWDNALDAFVYNGVTSLASAIAAGHYFGFSVTPDAGKQIDYSNILARVTLNDAGDGAGSSVQVVLMSSATGFADGDEIGSFTVVHAPGQGATDVTVTTNGFDVSGVASLQNQPSTIEFRLYIVPAGGSYSRVAVGHIFSTEADPDDIRVDGAVEDATTLPVIPLAMWDNDNVTARGARSNAVHTVAAGISASDLALSYRWFNDLSPWPNSIWALCSDLPAVTNLSESIASNRYFSVFMEPAPGKQADYTRFSVRITLNAGWAGDGDTAVKFYLMSSATGFNPGDEIGSFTATRNNAADGGSATDNGLIGMDISTVSALQNITDEVEFRIYVVLTDGDSNRWGIGHIFYADAQDDVLVEGRIEDAPFFPATIVGWDSVSGSVMKMEISAPSAAMLYYPKATTSLNTVPWAGVPHSDDGVNPFVVTNLTYSTTEGSNKVIYVETTDTAKFFGIGGE